MQKYYNNVISSLGKPVQGASITVLSYPSNTTATIYSDNGITVATNPLTTDQWGQFSFYAADGRYSFSVTANGVVQYSFTDVILEDVTDGGSVGTFSALVIGTGAVLGGATNPITSNTSSANNYIQNYIYNKTAGASSSADFVAYGDNSTDAHGWADIGFTSSAYADATYTVTGPNESYVFGSAPSGSGKTGNLVFSTDNTGTANAIQWYAGGFTQAKTAYKMQLDQLGNFYLKPQTSPPALTINGDMVFNMTSNTNLRISFRGSDGTTRVANITLA